MNPHRSLGIRVTPKIIYYCIATDEESETEITVLDSLIIPIALTQPEKLKFIRTTFYDIIRQFKITNSGIRITESNAQNLNIERLNIEGVIQELLASSPIKYFTGQVSNISSKLGFQRSSFKEFVSGNEIFQDIEGWNSFGNEQKESILTAIAALKL